MSAEYGHNVILRCRRCMRPVHWSDTYDAFITSHHEGPFCGTLVDREARDHLVAPIDLTPDNVRRFLARPTDPNAESQR